MSPSERFPALSDTVNEIEMNGDRGHFSILVTVNGKTACVSLPELPAQERVDIFHKLKSEFRNTVFTDLEKTEKMVLDHLAPYRKREVERSSKKSGIRRKILSIFSL